MIEVNFRDSYLKGAFTLGLMFDYRLKFIAIIFYQYRLTISWKKGDSQ